MKNFLKTTLAVIVGFFICIILTVLFFGGMLGSMMSSSSTPVIPSDAVLNINMSEFTVSEQGSQYGSMDVQTILSGDNVPQIGVWDAVRAISVAANDPSVKYIFLRPDGASAGVAQLQELRQALVKFRESGKAVVSYLEAPSNGSYYLASVSDKIYLSSASGGMNTLVGMSGRLMFLKDLFDKIGINMQLIRHGKYKSAGEMYIRNSASKENLEQNQVMINTLWGEISGVMAESRGLSVEKFNELIDNLELNLPKDFLENGLVDELVSYEQLVEKLCNLAVVEKKDDLHLVRFADYIAAKLTPAVSLKGRNDIAIIFANGEIVEGDKEGEDISGDYFARVIDEVRKNDNVKAVVLRVNSPGGSVSASAKIRAALDRLQQEKPLVASYGDYAASGGYWISNGCDKIFSNATTLTGSIGVFSMIPDFGKVVRDKAHVNMTFIKSNKHSDMLSGMRALDAQELAYMQESVEVIYDEFVNLVAEGRDMTPSKVDEIAQGRVWAGADAIGIGLVDELGTLEDAVEYAASLARERAGLPEAEGYADFTVSSYPEPMDMMNMLLNSLKKDSNTPQILSGTPFEALEEAAAALKLNQPSKIYARMPYSIDIR